MTCSRSPWFYLFDPATALAGVSMASSVVGGMSNAKESVDNANMDQEDIADKIDNSRISAARQLRDIDKDTEQNVALMRARAAAKGGSTSDVGHLQQTARVLTETNISKARIKEDTKANVNSLLRLSGNIKDKAKSERNSGLLGGLMDAGATGFNLFGGMM